MTGAAILPPGMRPPGRNSVTLTVRPLEVEIGDVLPGFTRPVARIIQHGGHVCYYDSTGCCLTLRQLGGHVRIVRRGVTL